MQFRGGCSFAGLLNIKPGHKVLDMCCGTGEVTRFLAELVGENSEVVGECLENQNYIGPFSTFRIFSSGNSFKVGLPNICMVVQENLIQKVPLSC